jgi:hypothetical protein
MLLSVMQLAVRAEKFPFIPCARQQSETEKERRRCALSMIARSRLATLAAALMLALAFSGSVRVFREHPYSPVG